MKEISISRTKDLVGQEVALYGWVGNRRDHGKLIFIDLRDRTGVLQVVFTPKQGQVYEEAQKLRDEWVVRLHVRIKERPESMRNDELATGSIEAEPLELEVLAEAQTPPIPVNTDGREIGEDARLKFRYLDLRRPRMAANLQMRNQAMLFARNWLTEREFTEVETPILTKSTPEGARDYVVPSRIKPGTFYALPQAPQQYKQLLMAAGVEKYFQFARCFRDEDTRGDRQPEFTQLDMELSFVDREDVLAVNEELFIALVTQLWPHKRIQTVPFPRLTYAEAMERYDTDRPDLREDKEDPHLLAFCWIVDFPFFEKNAEGGWTFTHNPFSLPKKEHVQDLLDGTSIGDILTTQYDISLNGWEIGGGSIRAHQPELLRAVFRIMGLSDEDIEASVGHLLEAFSYGAPPHGGIAWGWDRFLSLLQNEPNIREVIAFPKTGDARDPMMDSPSGLSAKQLRELHLHVKEEA
jgi:aspartyl-tRNA synthetase